MNFFNESPEAPNLGKKVEVAVKKSETILQKNCWDHRSIATSTSLYPFVEAYFKFNFVNTQWQHLLWKNFMSSTIQAV